MVCERFQRDDVALWSLAAWGRYDKVTDFIDPKQSFSGVGTSLGRFVYLAIERMSLKKETESYFFVHFAETLDQILALYNQFVRAWKKVDLYPTAAKFGKQLEYADKKGIRYAVIMGETELKQCIYKVKDLMTGEEEVVKM